MKQTTFSFPQIVNRASKEVKLSNNTKSINECLGILLRTRPGELLGDPSYGCFLLDRVFRYNGVIIEPLIREDIVTAISKYEPRIIVKDNDIVIRYDKQVLTIYLTYEIKETGEINEFNLEITSEDNPDRPYDM